MLVDGTPLECIAPTLRLAPYPFDDSRKHDSSPVLETPMPFAATLGKSLQDRGSEVPAEIMRGDSLEDVLNRHLLTVEKLGEGDVVTCILLLSADGKVLSVGAAPTLPSSYCRVGDSFEIGLTHGSCAAAAYLGRPVYSIDIETDPIWADFG